MSQLDLQFARSDCVQSVPVSPSPAGLAEDTLHMRRSVQAAMALDLQLAQNEGALGQLRCAQFLSLHVRF